MSKPATSEELRLELDPELKKRLEELAKAAKELEESVKKFDEEMKKLYPGTSQKSK